MASVNPSRTSDDAEIDRQILRIAGPAAIALLTDPLYELTDVAILSTLGSEALGGAALAVRVLSLTYATFIFLTFATTARVARLRGKGDTVGATETAISAVWIACALGVGLMAVLALAGRPILQALGGEGDVLETAWVYLRTSIWGLPAFLIVLAGTGYLRGCSDTKTPLLISAAAVALNLILEVVLIFGLKAGVEASAGGTVVAKWFSAAVLLVFISRDRSANGVSLRPVWAHARRLGRVGGSLVLRTAALLGTITAASSLAARLGVSALAAHSIVFGIWMFSVFASDGIEVAGQTLIAQHLGRNDGLPDRRRLVGRLLRWSLIVGCGLGAILVVLRSPLIGLFTNDSSVITLAQTPLWCLALLQPINAVTFGVDGILVGAGRQSRLALFMASAAVGFGLTVWGGYAVAPAQDRLATVWIALTVFSVIRCALGLYATFQFTRSVTQPSEQQPRSPRHMRESW